jgi:intracellular sulfur oxidation DsrE/DsrF family protein
MEKSDNIGDQMLGAFVDGLLDAEHSALVIEKMEDDPETRNQVYQLRRAKDLMKLGFADVRAPSNTPQKFRRSIWKQYSSRIAASVAAVAVSFSAGALGYHYYAEQGNAVSAVASATQQHADRVILHISEPDPEQFANVLAYMDKFLDKHAAESSRIEVVANAGGINFMRGPISPFKSQIIAMMDKHDNVQFIACASGLRVLRNQGIEPIIIKGVGTDTTAIDHIVKRLQSGWSYIKVDSLSET